MAAELVVNSVKGARYTQNMQAREHMILADEPGSVGGDDRGPTPYELLLSALGS